jgi:Potential Queuosine, Q, salvage protein family
VAVRSAEPDRLTERSPPGSTEPRPDPLGVRAATAWVVERARDVRLVPERIAAVAERVATSQLSSPPWRTPPHWWSDADPDATAHYVLLLDALNFSFWGTPRWRVAWDGRVVDGYWALAAALRVAIERGEPLTDPAYLARGARASELLRGVDDVPIPLLRAREAALREVGQGLLLRCDGRFRRCLEDAGGSAPAIARLVAERFPSFRDVAEYERRPVPLYKRAQLLAADLFGAFDGRRPWAPTDLDQLTMFADYKVPQVLQALGALAYSEELVAALRARAVFPYGDRREVEIRAASVQAVDRICQRAHVPPYQVDWALWSLGQTMALELPYHRTRSVYY